MADVPSECGRRTPTAPLAGPPIVAAGPYYARPGSLPAGPWSPYPSPRSPSCTTVAAPSLPATTSPSPRPWTAYATVDLGAYLPNVRYPTDRWIGVHVDVGKTNVENSGQLFERYALIASQPDGEVGKVSDLVVDMLVTSAGIGALVGLTGPALWMLVGQRRRHELVQTVGGPRRLMIAATGTAARRHVPRPSASPGSTTSRTRRLRTRHGAPSRNSYPEPTFPPRRSRSRCKAG